MKKLLFILLLTATSVLGQAPSIKMFNTNNFKIQVPNNLQLQENQNFGYMGLTNRGLLVTAPVGKTSYVYMVQVDVKNVQTDPRNAKAYGDYDPLTNTGHDDYVALTNSFARAMADNATWVIPGRTFGISKPLVIDGALYPGQRIKIQGASSWSRISFIPGPTSYDALIVITNAPYQIFMDCLEIQGSDQITNAMRLDHVAHSSFSNLKWRDCVNAGCYPEESVNNLFLNCTTTQPGLFTRQAPAYAMKFVSNCNENTVLNLIGENLSTNGVLGAGIYLDSTCNNNRFIGGSQEFVYRGIENYGTDNSFDNIDMESNFLDDVWDAGKGSSYHNVLSTKLFTLASPGREQMVDGGRYEKFVINSGVAGAVLKAIKHGVISTSGTYTDNGTGTLVIHRNYLQDDSRFGLVENDYIQTPTLNMTQSKVDANPGHTNQYDPWVYFVNTNAPSNYKKVRMGTPSGGNYVAIQKVDDAIAIASQLLQLLYDNNGLTAGIMPGPLTLGSTARGDANMLTVISTNLTAGSEMQLEHVYTNGGGGLTNIFRYVRNFAGSLQLIDNGYTHAGATFTDAGDAIFSKTGGASMTLKDEADGSTATFAYDGNTTVGLSGSFAATGSGSFSHDATVLTLTPTVLNNACLIVWKNSIVGSAVGSFGVAVNGDTDMTWAVNGGNAVITSPLKFRISSTDTGSGYLTTKILPGSNITFITNNPGGVESITIAASGGGGGGSTNYNFHSPLTTTDTTNVFIANNGIDNTYLRQGAGTSVIGRSAGSSGNVADITATADSQFLQRKAGALVWDTLPTTVGSADELILNTLNTGTDYIGGSPNASVFSMGVVGGTNCQVTLPTAGTYKVEATYAIYGANIFSDYARFYNFTTSTVASPAFVGSVLASTSQLYTKTISKLITTSTINNVIQLQFASDDTVYGHRSLMDTVWISYVRLY